MIERDFSRVDKLVDIPKLHETTIGCVGGGGSAVGLASFVQSGVGTIILFEPDTVGIENIPRQAFLLRQVGMLKIDAIRENLLAINPDLNFIGIPKKVEDATQEELQLLKEANLLLCLAGSHTAALVINKLAICWKIPAIYAGFYPLSRACEIVFYIPNGVTAPYCCAVAPRIKQHAERKTELSNESNPGNGSFHVLFLEGMIGMIAMAILHNQADGYEFSSWFGARWERNFLQIKTHPDYQSALFKHAFENVEGGAMPFNALWRKTSFRRQPHYEDCPICTDLHIEKKPAIY